MHVADSDKTPETPSRDVPADATADEIARALGMTEEVVRSQAGAAEEGVLGSGPLELDKDGALIGSKKLQPKRAIRQDEDEAELDGEPEAASVEREGKPRKAALPPKLSLLRPAEVEAEARAEALWADGIDPRFAETIPVEAGRFLFGDDGTSRGVPAFCIDRYATTNRQYEAFVRATGHRPPLYWPNGHLDDELATHPVVGVDYFDALAYARWIGKDLPFEDEWERAARGTDGRTYPWGNENELGTANTARSNLKMTVPVDAHPGNVSPVGCADMVGNAWELTHSPAPGGGVVVRGGSWYDFVLYAKTFFRFAAASDARNGTIGFRCVERDAPRDEAPREIDVAQVEAEVISRTGPQPPVDRASWDADKRDLVPDHARLRTFVAEVEAERLMRGPTVAPRPPQDPAPPQPPSPLTPALDETDAPPVKPAAPMLDLPDASPEREPAPEPAQEADLPDDHDDYDEPDEAKTPETPETPEEPEAASEPAREHVEDRRGAPVGTSEVGTPEGPDRSGFEQAAEAVVQAETLARAEDGADAAPARTPKMLWGLLGLGFLLVGGVVFAIVNRGGNDAGKPVGVDPLVGAVLRVDFLAKLPPLPGPQATIAPFKLLDGADAEARELLAEGNWLLVFVDPAATGSLRTIQSTTNIALRMHTSGAQVALVLPRASYASDGVLPEAARLAELVQEQWRMEGLTVVLDPADGLRQRFLGDAPGLAAVVTHAGQLEAKAWAAKDDEAFTVHGLAPIAAEAHLRSPSRAARDG